MNLERIKLLLEVEDLVRPHGSMFSNIRNEVIEELKAHDAGEHEQPEQSKEPTPEPPPVIARRPIVAAEEPAKEEEHAA